MKRLFYLFALSVSPAFGQSGGGIDSLAYPKPLDFIAAIKQFPSVRDFAISPDGTEVFFTTQTHFEEFSALVYARKEGNVWSEIKLAPFSGTFFDLEPFYAADGLRLYFASNRPLVADELKTKDFDIWYVERSSKNDPWSKPINLGSPVNSTSNEFYPSLAANKNLYFTSDRSGTKGKDDIFYSEFKKGKYKEPQALSDSINSSNYEFNAFVYPDESMLLFTAYQRKEGFGSGDLYYSKRDATGNWTKAVNLGAMVNSDKMDYCPFVHVASNTLYFTSKRNALLTETGSVSSVEELLQKMHSYENGLSRIYWFQMKF